MCAYTEARWNAMIAAIESLRQQTVSPLEVILVIDHNTALFERTRSALPDITVIENHEPRGLSGARNSALPIAKGDILAFIDEDAIAAPDWIAHLQAGYENDQIIGVGGVIEPLWQAGKPRWFPEEFAWVVGCTYKGMPETKQPVRNLIGCNMSFKREVFEAVGGFRSGIGRIGTLPVGCEETELCIRARQHWPEAVFLYNPQARVQHRVPPERATWRYFVTRCYSEGISKALISSFVGAKAGLSSERAYTLKTLPQGVLRGLRDILRRDLAGLGRATAIMTGLGFTTFGYLKGEIGQRWAARKQARLKDSSLPHQATF